MEYDGFGWDSGNREKCQKHGMPIAEIETIFERLVVILPDKENPLGERRYRAIGTTADGRICRVHSEKARRYDAPMPDQRTVHTQQRDGSL